MGKLTSHQIIFLSRLMNSLGRQGFAGGDDRTMARGLLVYKLIERFGRVGGKQKYRVTEKCFREGRTFLKELLLATKDEN